MCCDSSLVSSDREATSVTGQPVTAREAVGADLTSTYRTVQAMVGLSEHRPTFWWVVALPVVLHTSTVMTIKSSKTD